MFCFVGWVVAIGPTAGTQNKSVNVLIRKDIA